MKCLLLLLLLLLDASLVNRRRWKEATAGDLEGHWRRWDRARRTAVRAVVCRLHHRGRSRLRVERSTVRPRGAVHHWRHDGISGASRAHHRGSLIPWVRGSRRVIQDTLQGIDVVRVISGRLCDECRGKSLLGASGRAYWVERGRG